MGNKKDQKQSVETKKVLNPSVTETFYGEGGLVPEAQKAYREGGFAPTSKHTDRAKDLFRQAGGQSNVLLPQAMESAKGFLQGGYGTSQGLETQLQDQAGRLTAGVEEATAYPGLLPQGSPKNDSGIVGERMRAALAPAQQAALSQDFGQRSDLQQSFAQAAPQLGAAPRDDLGRKAQLLGRSSALEAEQMRAPFENLKRYAGLLDVPTQKTAGGVGTTVTPGGSRLAGAVGGGLSAFAATGNPWVALGGAALGAMG